MRSLILVLLLLVSACATEPDIVYRSVHTKVQCSIVDKQEGLSLHDISVVKAIEDKGNIVVGLSGTELSKFYINSELIISYIVIQKETINYYEKCITDHNNKTKKEEQ